MKNRNASGNMLVLVICIIAVVLIPFVIVVGTWGPYFLNSGQAQDVVDAASLIAANDIGRIVIDDPKFGFVSLSNHAPVGKAVCAPDGHPLPVTGINTLIGTLRQNAIIADELDNTTMFKLVDDDLASLKATTKELNAKIYDAATLNTYRNGCTDAEGKDVTPIADVQEFLTEHLPPKMRLESFKISVGWLKSGSETTVPIPQPEKLAQVNTADIRAGKYSAFHNYPVRDDAFVFAGVGPQTRLVSAKDFREYNPKYICSVVKLECTLVSTDESQTKSTVVACCQPSSQADFSIPGAMTVRFAGKPVPGLLSWSDFLSVNSFYDNKITPFDITGGDFPYDPKAKMEQYDSEGLGTTPQLFAEHLYCWLRNGHVRPRIDAVLSMIHDSFRYNANEVYVYQFKNDGSIDRNILESHRFAPSVAAEGQFTAMADTRTKSGRSAIIIFRDNVHQLSSDGSEHGGQPLAGFPLSTVDSGIDRAQLAQSFGDRRHLTNGLALDIEIGGTGEVRTTEDVASMRERTSGRKI